VGGRRWTLGSLSAVIALDQLHGYAFVVFAPEIARSLHVSTNGLATAGLLRGAGFVAVAAGVGALIRRGGALRVARRGAAVRAGALAVGGVVGAATVIGSLAVYGAAGASGANAHRPLLRAGDHETHRLAGRLGNAAVALLIGALAYALTWSQVFMALAVLAAVAAAATLRADTADHGADPIDDSVHRLAAVPGGRVALAAIVASGLVEFPMYIVVFAHLGAALHVSVMGRASIIAAAELAGVAANVLLGQRLNGARARSAHALGLGLVLAVAFGFGAIVVAMMVTTVAAAVIALGIGTVATSVTVPLLAVGTRAVLADAVPRRVAFVTTAGLAGVLLAAPANDPTVVAALAVLPVVAALGVAGAALRWSGPIADALHDVANVTPSERMLPTGAVLHEA
jgi:hypothetical protein